MPADKRRQRRVPTKYKKPRPMASGSRRSRLSRLFAFEMVAALVLVALALGRPAAEVDEWLTAELLKWVVTERPPSSVIALTVGPEALRSGACPAVLGRVLSDGRARAAVVLSTLDELCRLSPIAPGPPRTTLEVQRLRRAGDAIVGFEPGALAAPTPTWLPAADGRWLASRPWRSVPAASLSDLVAGRVEAGVLDDRVVVVGLDESVEADAARAGPLVYRTAGMIAASIEDRPRREARALHLGAVAALLGIALALAHRYRRRRRLAWSLRAVAMMALVAATLAGLTGHGWLMPLASLLFAAGVFQLMVFAPIWVARVRGTNEALRVLERIRELGSEDVSTIEDRVFWARLARRVADSHPADNVLLAELPPFSWRLVIHANEDVSEVVIAERRRDVRRTPYTDVESGQRRIKVAARFVVMKDVPTLLVPLETAGELEGYVFLTGEAAKDAFQREPAATERMAREVAKLIRQRRLARGRADDWRRPAGLSLGDPGERSTRIVEGARAALGKLEQLGRVARSAPVGLLYADAFGDVRMLGDTVAEWFARMGIDVPASEKGRLLPPGALPLSRVLEVLARETGTATLRADELTSDGRVYELASSNAHGRHEGVTFTLRRLDDGDAPYYVAALAELPEHEPGESDNVQRLPEQGDPLGVFSMAKLLVAVVESVTRRAEGHIRLQSPRALAHVLGHQRELRDALQLFLSEVAGRAESDSGPTLTIEEHPERVEICFLDVQLGVPPAAVKRTLLAPSMPPPGMSALGAFARAVENSHGSVRMKHEDSWGVEITASFLRARPRVELDPSAQLIELPKAPRVPKADGDPSSR